MVKIHSEVLFRLQWILCPHCQLQSFSFSPNLFRSWVLWFVSSSHQLYEIYRAVFYVSELFLVKYISTFTLYRDCMLIGYLVLAIMVILHGISHLWDFSFNIYEISQSFCVDLSRYHSKNQAHPSICRYTS